MEGKETHVNKKEVMNKWKFDVTALKNLFIFKGKHTLP